MPRAFASRSSPDEGTLLFVSPDKDTVDIVYVPSAARIEQAGVDLQFSADYKVKLLQISGRGRYITMYPVNTFGNARDFLKQKYRRIRSITLDQGASLSVGDNAAMPHTTEAVLELLERLPAGFVKDFDFGLGLTREYRFIVSAVEGLSECSEIVISDQQTECDEELGMFFLKYSDYERLRKDCNKFTQRARSAASVAKDAGVYNFLAYRLGREQRPLKLPQTAINRMVSDGAASGLMDEAEQDAVLSALERNSRAIAERKPEKLAQLRDDIELVTLEVLIGRYEEMLGKRLGEASWQSFFNANPFVLNLAFGYPVIKVQDQASVGGRRLAGGGDKIADFLMKNSLTNNTAIIEIKTPQAHLLNKKPVRGGVYTPAADLTGALAQVLDQKFRLEGDIATIMRSSRLTDLETYSIHCCLIVGTTPAEPEHVKCFEMFRRNSKAVEIVTFDELLEKLRGLRDLLRPAQQQS